MPRTRLVEDAASVETSGQRAATAFVPLTQHLSSGPVSQVMLGALFQLLPEMPWGLPHEVCSLLLRRLPDRRVVLQVLQDLGVGWPPLMPGPHPGDHTDAPEVVQEGELALSKIF